MPTLLTSLFRQKDFFLIQSSSTQCNYVKIKFIILLLYYFTPTTVPYLQICLCTAVFKTDMINNKHVFMVHHLAFLLLFVKK